MKRYILFIILLVGSFFVFAEVFSANTDIIINEIGAYPTSTHEWIEIWNKGGEPVDLADWRFWENSTNHRLEATTTDAVVSPGEYAAIAQDAEQFIFDHPGFTGSIFDSSWSSLNESGEEVGLKDNEENFVEQFVYIPAPNCSLERKNPFWADYTSANWQEHASGDTLGFINSNFSTSTTSTEPNSGGNTSTIWAQLKINEFVPNPETGNEWVELYNPTTSSLDISGGLICDARNATSTCKAITGTVSATGWLFIDLLTASYLNNDGDAVILKNLEGAIVDQITFGNGNFVPAKGQALARKVDGADTESDVDWAITTQPTPGAKNVIRAPEKPPSHHENEGGSGDLPPQDKPTLPPSSTLSSIIINEIYPNPPGSDLLEEFIEVKNISAQAVSLQGWKLGNTSKNFLLYGEIGPGQFIIWKRPATKIALKNTAKEEVKLYDSNGALVDKVEYNGAPEGESYSRDEKNAWQWTSAPTPGLENKIVKKDNVGLIWKINAPASAEPGEMVVFDAEDTADPRGGDLSFNWDLGDGAILSGGEVEHAFATSGVYQVMIFASSTSGTAGQKQITITVGSGLSIVNSGIVLSEVFPNPDGSDSREFIELYNSGSSTVDLSSWILRNRAGKMFIIPSSTMILPNNFLIFYRAATRFSLDNSGDKAELLSPDKNLVDMVKFGKSEVGLSYNLIGDEWQWDDPNPGKLLSVSSLSDSEDALGADEQEAKSDKTVKDTTYSLVSIAQARELDKDEGARVRGVVTVLPGVFGVQYFYISDENAGIQIYQNKKDFPDLSVGDRVEVKGIISEASGVKRIKVKNSRDIDILATDQKLPELIFGLGDLEDASAGALVKIKGEITEIKSNLMYIDDGIAEVVVYFKKNAKIDKSKVKEGENAEVSGVLEQSKTGLQIWPRSNDDILSLGPSEDLLKKQTALEKQGQSSDTAEKYLTATAGGVTTLLLGFMARARGAAIKRVALTVVGFIRKRKV